MIFKWFFFPAFAHHCLSVNLEDLQEYSGSVFFHFYESKSFIMGNPELQGSSLAAAPHGQTYEQTEPCKSTSPSCRAVVFKPPGPPEPAPVFLTYVVFNANFHHMPNSKL